MICNSNFSNQNSNLFQSSHDNLDNKGDQNGIINENSSRKTEDEEGILHLHYLCSKQGEINNIVSPFVDEPPKEVVSKLIARDNSINVIKQRNYVGEPIISSSHHYTAGTRQDEKNMMAHTKNNNKLVTNNNNIKKCHHISGSITGKLIKN